MKRKTFLATIAAAFLAKPAIAQTTYRNGYCPTCGTKGKDAPKVIATQSVTGGHLTSNLVGLIYEMPVFDRTPESWDQTFTSQSHPFTWFADFCDHCGTLFRTKKER